MTIQEIRDKFLEFYVRADYKEFPASSLIPESDPSVLFTTAGMQQFKDFYEHPDVAPISLATTVQPVIRTSDISEVGDDTHLTMFEMLGNFILGADMPRALKETAIDQAWEFVTNTLKVDPSRITVTVFGGEGDVPPDTESEEIWQKYNVKITKEGKADNFWGPTGDSGPCGPTTEIYIDGIEVWNLVFNQYISQGDGSLNPLPKTGLDTGSGLERLTATLDGKTSVWDIEPFSIWTKLLQTKDKIGARVVVDHLRALIFITSENILPGNKGREYVARRLMRKVIFLEKQLNLANIENLIGEIIAFHSNYTLIDKAGFMAVYNQEKKQFETNLTKSIAYLEKWLLAKPSPTNAEITELAFNLYGSYGFPRELVIDYLKQKGHQVDQSHFDNLFSKHQEVSRQGLEKQFKGGLADNDPKTVKHHTAHHLLLAALRKVLGDQVFQRGSNVNNERLRLDFSYPTKLTVEQLSEVETQVNEWINQDLPVVSAEMNKDEALKSGAMAEFGQKYGDTVTVYSIGDISKELCGGPHISKTGELGHFYILKEEAVAQGIRRIKARVE